MIRPREYDLLMAVLAVADPASDCAIGNDEIDRARRIIQREYARDHGRKVRR